MAYSYWQVGLHFQPTEIVCVALQRTRVGYALRRWWTLPVLLGAGEPEIVAQLVRLQREIPRFHRLAVALPAAETLQKQLPSPQVALRESEQAQWIGTTVAQQLDMPADTLVFDYTRADTKSYSVTAARRRDTERLVRRLTAAGLNLCMITPDACALQNFLPWAAQEKAGIDWHDGEQWLWATRDSWGCSAEHNPEFLICTTESAAGETFNPWFPLNQLQPPLPDSGDPYAIALALALGVS